MDVDIARRMLGVKQEGNYWAVDAATGVGGVGKSDGLILFVIALLRELDGCIHGRQGPSEQVVCIRRRLGV